jgi:hypothetical protein|tara:strand:+ start:1558 stop:1692 length:135 start_codon:yes stop_codon:yes gene_type:complete
MAINTSVSGKIINRMGKAPILSKMAINTLVNGKIINRMGKALSL